MDENAIRQWFIDCFGPIQGEMAWNQFSNMPEELRDQLMSQDVSKLPKPAEVRSMMQAFTAGGLNTFGDIQHITEEGPTNVKLAKVIGIAAGQWRRIGNQCERGVRRDGPASHQRGESVA